MRSPVLFLVFNRPEPTAEVFAAIRAARPPRLYVAADGARPNRSGEAQRAEETRRVATAVDWPCEVKTLFRDRNLGCKQAVSQALDWFFECEPEGIVLEDDCVPDPSFFRSWIEFSNPNGTMSASRSSAETISSLGGCTASPATTSR